MNSCVSVHFPLCVVFFFFLKLTGDQRSERGQCRIDKRHTGSSMERACKLPCPPVWSIFLYNTIRIIIVVYYGIYGEREETREYYEVRKSEVISYVSTNTTSVCANFLRVILKCPYLLNPKKVVSVPF